MTKEQLIALLKEARKELARHRFNQESPACVLCGGESGFDVGRRCPEAHDYDLAMRIDAAVVYAERTHSIQWVRIPAGSVTTQDGRVLTVEKDFELAANPTTQAQYEAVMGVNPSHFKGPDRPVEMVSATEADAFAQKIGARLPTETEWEYALLAGNPADPYGPIEDIAWCWENSNKQTHVVGLKKPNAWGLYDMLGNVWEWTSSVEGQQRVFRGGSWYSVASWLRGAYRDWYVPWYRFDYLGFRCARDIRGDDDQR